MTHLYSSETDFNLVEEPSEGDIQSVAGGDATASTSSSAAPERSGRFRKFAFVVGNLLLAYHVLAIAIAPSSIPPSSQLQRDSWLAFGPYLEAMYLNHGWHFFAPDPGASTLLEYRGIDSQGSTVEGRMPDKSTMKPRLLYHRHFMLTEALPRMQDADVNLRSGYYQALADGVGKMTGLKDVELIRVTHRLPTMQAVRAGFPLDDPAQYDSEPMGRFTCRP